MPSQLLANLFRHAGERPDAPAVEDDHAGDGGGGRVFTYGQLAAAVTAAAAELRARLPERAVVLLSCPQRVEFWVAYLAVLAAGCDVFPVSQELTADEWRAAPARPQQGGPSPRRTR